MWVFDWSWIFRWDEQLDVFLKLEDGIGNRDLKKKIRLISINLTKEYPSVQNTLYRKIT